MPLDRAGDGPSENTTVEKIFNASLHPALKAALEKSGSTISFTNPNLNSASLEVLQFRLDSFRDLFDQFVNVLETPLGDHFYDNWGEAVTNFVRAWADIFSEAGVYQAILKSLYWFAATDLRERLSVLISTPFDPQRFEREVQIGRIISRFVEGPVPLSRDFSPSYGSG